MGKNIFTGLNFTFEPNEMQNTTTSNDIKSNVYVKQLCREQRPFCFQDKVKDIIFKKYKKRAYIFEEKYPLQ